MDTNKEMTNSMEKYEIEIGSTTYRTYYITAESQEKAEELALDEVGNDFEISKAWAENAEVTCVKGEPVKFDREGKRLDR